MAADHPLHVFAPDILMVIYPTKAIESLRFRVVCQRSLRIAVPKVTLHLFNAGMVLNVRR